MANEQSNTNELMAQKVAETTRATVHAMAAAEAEEHKMWDPD